MIVAQQFTAGIKSGRKGSPRSGWLDIRYQIPQSFSRPLHELHCGCCQSQRWIAGLL